MHTRNQTTILLLRECLLFLIILAIVLISNIPIISLDMMYPEQPLFYLANQSIHHIGDFINIYLHPKLLHLYVPFFRPSGHFLMYQILTPILGWHNTKSFIVVNLIFLALTGYVTIKLYELLFPSYKIGGYIAFSIYLMHPALILSRLIIMHFEFAYIFFTMLGLYCFVRFCQMNLQFDGNKLRSLRFHDFGLLAAAIVFYAIAITFKEPAMMLGSVMGTYFLLALYNGQSFRSYFNDILLNSQIRQIFFLLMMSSITLAFYLTLAWPTLSHPWRNHLQLTQHVSALNEFLKNIFSTKWNLITRVPVDSPDMMWRQLDTPILNSMIIWTLTIISIAGTFLLYRNQSRNVFNDKKSLFFLYVSSFIFLILPIGWAMGLPWHLSLTILFLSMAAGFCFEYCSRLLSEYKNTINVIGVMIALMIGLSGYFVNQAYKLPVNDAFAINVTRNAVLHPPKLKDQLNADSVVIVEDSSIHDDYMLGNSAYPFSILSKDFDFNTFERSQRLNHIKYQSSYNGNLFRWAYLMPALQEDLYPFQVDKMNEVSDDVIYNWLQNYNNIFCLGYDKQANWHDKTARFKRNLLREKSRRNLVVNQYSYLPAESLNGKIISVTNLPYPDFHLCQFNCDQDRSCVGFNYISAEIQQKTVTQCQLMSRIHSDNTKFCATCIGFIKDSHANNFI